MHPPMARDAIERVRLVGLSFVVSKAKKTTYTLLQGGIRSESEKPNLIRVKCFYLDIFLILHLSIILIKHQSCIELN